MKNEYWIFIQSKSHLNLVIDIYDPKRRMRSLKTYTEHIYTKLHKALLELKCEELKAFMTEYKEREEAMAYRLTRIQHERLELRKRLKSNEIDSIQYQKLWMPLHKEKGQIVGEMNRFVDDALHTLYPDDRITLSEVKDFIEKYYETSR